MIKSIIVKILRWMYNYSSKRLGVKNQRLTREPIEGFWITQSSQRVQVTQSESDAIALEQMTGPIAVVDDDFRRIGRESAIEQTSQRVIRTFKQQCLNEDNLIKHVQFEFEQDQIRQQLQFIVVKLLTVKPRK